MTTPPMTTPMKRLGAGIGMQGLSFVTMALLQVASVPVLLSAWGSDAYGLWLIAIAASGLLSLCDFGLQGSLCNALRRSAARGESEDFRAVLDGGLGVYLVLMAGLAAVLAAATALGLPGQAGLDPAVAAPLAGSILILMPRGLVATVYSARGQFGRESGLGLIFQLGQTLAPMVAALAGGGPVLAAWLHLISAVVMGWLVLAWDLSRRHPDLALRPSLAGLAELRPLLGKAPLYALTNGLPVLLLHAPVMVLGWVGGSALAVVAFTTMRTITGLARQAANLLSVAAGVEMASLHARADRPALRRIMTLTGDLAAVLIGVAAGALLILGPPFYELWTRGKLAFDLILAASFLLPMLINVPACGAIGLLRHIDRPGPMARAVAAQTALSLAALFPLTRLYGPEGAAAALALGEVLVLGAWSLRDAAAELGIPALPLAVRAWILAVLATGGGIGLCLLLRDWAGL